MSAVRIRLNGDPHELPHEMSILSLLKRLALDPRTVAVELDRVVIRRQRYGETTIRDGAEVEIVGFVGGGWGETEQVRS